jgi:hypothetical protein
MSFSLNFIYKSSWSNYNLLDETYKHLCDKFLVCNNLKQGDALWPLTYNITLWRSKNIRKDSNLMDHISLHSVAMMSTHWRKRKYYEEKKQKLCYMLAKMCQEMNTRKLGYVHLCLTRMWNKMMAISALKIYKIEIFVNNSNESKYHQMSKCVRSPAKQEEYRSTLST